MSLPDELVELTARKLFQAEATREQIGLLSLQYPDASIDEGYQIQQALIDLKEQSGLKRKGWKIGLTSRAMQQALGIETPDSGILFDNMFFENGSRVPPDRFIQPRVEAEIAFVLKHELSGEVTIFDVLDATDYVCPALEILDTRIKRVDEKTGKRRNVFDTISDNAANGGIVIGGRPMRPLDIDMTRAGVAVSKNGWIEETGLGAGVLGNPALAIVWLSRRLGQYGGRLSAGDVVLSGSFIRPVEAGHGDTIMADYGSFGSVSIYFE